MSFSGELIDFGRPSARRILEDDAKLAPIKYIVDGVETGAIPQISKIFPFEQNRGCTSIPRVQRAIWQGGRDDLINSLIVDSGWIGGFEHLLHLGFRLGKLSMCL